MFHSLRLTASLFKPLTTLTRTQTFTGGQGLNIYRSFYNNVSRTTPLRSNIIQKKLLEPKNALKTAICRYCNEAAKNPAKTKKVVGYWLLGSSGMVFVAVVLGAVSTYFGIMYCVLIVIEEVIKFTIR